MNPYPRIIVSAQQTIWDLTLKQSNAMKCQSINFKIIDRRLLPHPCPCIWSHCDSTIVTNYSGGFWRAYSVNSPVFIWDLPHDSSWCSLKRATWLTKFVQGYSDLTLFHEFISSSVPLHIEACLVLHSPISPDISPAVRLCERCSHLIQPLPAYWVGTVTFGLEVSSPAAWNSLPFDLRDPGLSLSSFRKKIKPIYLILLIDF